MFPQSVPIDGPELPVRASAGVEALTEQLRALFKPIDLRPAEQELLTRYRDWMTPSWSPFVARWVRTLAPLGTPPEFMAGLDFTPVRVTAGREHFDGLAFHAPGNSKRATLIAAQPKYTPAAPEPHYGHRLDALHCFLCENLAQARDLADRGVSPTNCLLDLGSHALIPNRYPLCPGHSLLVPKDHDGARNTRGRTLSFQELHLWMKVADELDSLLTRNHPHDAMSCPHHDHGHLIPLAFPLHLPFDAIRQSHGEYTPVLRAIVSPGTPFEHLILTAPTRELLAEVASPVLATFEERGLVFTLMYSRRTLCISHRKDDAREGPKLALGASSSFLVFGTTPDGDIGISPTQLNDQLPRIADSTERIVATLTDSDLRLPPAYHALQYQKLRPFGAGNNIKPRLSPELWELWERALSYQDKRHDTGHAEVVSLFAHLLSELEHLDHRTVRVAVAAAILHDVGWAQIEGIGERYREVMARKSSDDPHLRTVGISEDRELRVLHQNLGVDQQRALMSDARWDDIRDEVSAIISDHDTRAKGCISQACAIMWDADILWRVTLPGFQAGRLQLGTEDEVRLLAHQRVWAAPERYQTEWAKIIAPRELARAEELFNRASRSEDLI